MEDRGYISTIHSLYAEKALDKIEGKKEKWLKAHGCTFKPDLSLTVGRRPKAAHETGNENVFDRLYRAKPAKKFVQEPNPKQEKNEKPKVEARKKSRKEIPGAKKTPLFDANFINERDAKLSEEKARMDVKGCTFKPAINEKSRRLNVQSNLNQSVFERLHESPVKVPVHDDCVPTARIRLDVFAMLAAVEEKEESLKTETSKFGATEKAAEHDIAKNREAIPLEELVQSPRRKAKMVIASPPPLPPKVVQLVVGTEPDSFTLLKSQGANILKHGKRGRANHCRLTVDESALFWTSRRGETNRIPWREMIGVRKGKGVSRLRTISSFWSKTFMFRRSRSSSLPAKAGIPFFFTVIAEAKELVLSCSESSERDELVHAIGLGIYKATRTTNHSYPFSSHAKPVAVFDASKSQFTSKRSPNLRVQTRTSKGKYHSRNDDQEEETGEMDEESSLSDPVPPPNKPRPAPPTWQSK